MESVWTKLGAVDPRALLEARTQAHHAVQWVTRAARANLPPAPDDSHSNLGWDYPRRALVSHDLVAADGTACRAGLALDSMTLVITRGTGVLGDFALDVVRDEPKNIAGTVDQDGNLEIVLEPSEALLKIGWIDLKVGQFGCRPLVQLTHCVDELPRGHVGVITAPLKLIGHVDLFDDDVLARKQCDHENRHGCNCRNRQEAQAKHRPTLAIPI